ncbi:NBAS subunit of NRZ tethering complex-like [Watersipora subatra]|uniref:NBAS subunit of NRZ tethering complex-like n=1 Tax=Watersipora subatra TaxID=2589382 RepID=UPI00355C917E
MDNVTTSPCNLPISLVKLVNVNLNWSICLSPDAEYLAVLQESFIEVRSRRDNYATTIGKTKLKDDEEPQWRRMVWSEDSQLLALSYSTGSVVLLDIMCGTFFTIHQQPPKAVAVGDLSFAVASMMFSKPFKGADEKWDFTLTIINHQGLLSCYFLSIEEESYEMAHQFQFSFTYPQGVSSAVYSERHSLLIVTGLVSPTSDMLKTKAGQEGITAWRVLSGRPYYKRITDYDQDGMGGAGRGFIKKFTSAMYGAIYGDGMQELVLKSCLSPDGNHLLTLSTESKLCLYQMPSLTLINSWSADHQPCADQQSPTLAESSRKTKYLQEHSHYYKLLDIAWWSDKEVILARYSGAVLVADIENLSNRLGEFPEWFEACPQVQDAHDGGFLSLECESRLLSSRKRTVSEGTASAEESGSEDEEASSILSRTNRVLRETLFYITDMDRFEPPKKRTRLIKKTYKLVSLKSTTPDELFARKIDEEEYGEALVLAKLYHLDADLVYQRQWRKSDVTMASIHDYLSKIRKRAWVLHECLERVPNNIDAMRELLQYGLRGTDLEALAKIGQGRDKGRFIASKEVQLDDSYDEYDPESVAELEKLKHQHRQNLLDQIDFENLTLEQEELCRVRLHLLTYLDRLATYEEILGGGRAAEERFDAKFFQRFRSQNVVEAITDYAQAGDPNAVDTMFVFLGEQTLPHRLAILSNFPETLPPVEYAELLPLVKNGRVADYPQETLREPDWCELPANRKYIKGGNPDLAAEFLYEDNETLKPFRGQPLNPALLCQWYKARSCDIEERSRLVDHALEFVETGMKCGVKGLESLREDLSVMGMIVYECNYGASLTFKQLQEMDDLSRLKTIMSKATPDRYALHIQKWMRPFLERCEAKSPDSYQALLSRYLINLAVNDLQLVFKVFECSKADQPASQRLLSTEERLLKTAIECIYACEREDQLSFVLSILECLPNRKSGSMERSLIRLHNEVDEMEDLISAAEILESYGISMTISALRDSQNDANAATLLMKKLARRANNRAIGLTTAEWTQLQSDMSVLQGKVYRCIDKYTCCEIFVESLLCSGKKESIELAQVYMEGDTEHSSHSMTSSTGSLLDSLIPFDAAIDIVVRAAKEYFNSSGSHADHNMELAEACLRLFSSNHPKIKEELDLIQALPLLLDFGITLIPLRVRLCEDRLELIKEAIRSSKTSYKQYPKLLKLADGLRVTDCAVLQLVVHEALDKGDTKFAYKHCKNLIDKAYPDIWKECYQLASTSTFTDSDSRMALLSYSLVHCSDDMLEEVLAKRMALKAELLAARIQATAKDHPSDKPDRESTQVEGNSQTKLDWQTMFSTEAAAGALSLTTKHTKNLLSNLGDMKWIDKTVSFISGHSEDEGINKDNEFRAQGCHPFYEDIVDGCRPSIDLGSSASLKISFSDDVLRMRKLKEALSKGTTPADDCSEVLVQSAIHALPADVTLGLGFLMDISKSDLAETCFGQLPKVPLTLKLGAYYYALQLLSSLSMSVHGTVSETINLARQLSEQQLVRDEMKVLYEKLDLYVRLLEDHSQACYLQSLGKDVDSHRFTADNEYKRQTILSLTKSTDQVHYDTAIAMAKRYSVSLWDIYMRHLEYLLVDSGLTTSQVEKRVVRLKMAEELQKVPETFAGYMESEVLPRITSTDMPKLQLCYNLLDGRLTADPVSVETHRKMLSKLIPVAPGLDYGTLMRGTADAVAILRPVLKSGNVHVFSKLSGKIPTADGGHLSSSSVFNAYAQKLFTDGASANSKVPETSAAWVHRYESCGEYLGRMDACDSISFLKHVLFSDSSLDKVSLEARQEICRRHLKHCKARTSKDSGGMTWTEALETCKQFSTHLERMSSEAFVGLRLSENPQVQSYYKKIDACMSDNEKLKEVLTGMLLEGQVLELVDDILQVMQVDGWTVRHALNDAVLIICAHLRDGKSHLTFNEKPTLDTFESIITQVGEHQKEGGDLVNSEDVMSLFRPLIPDTSIDMDSRLLVLALLEKYLVLNKEDKLVVLLYQTQAIVSTHWPQVKVERVDVQSKSSRSRLFVQLIQNSTELRQFLTLPPLISVWPGPEASALWMNLLEAMLEKIGGEEAAESAVALCLEQRLPQGVMQHLYSLLKNNEHLKLAATLALKSESPVLQDDLLDMMHSYPQLFVDDGTIHRLVFKCHLLVNFVGSELFQPLVNYLALHQKEADFLEPNIVVNELLQAKYASEAAAVDKVCRSQHGSKSLAAAGLSALSRWWRKD